MKTENSSVLVTGAAGGIGACVARRLGRTGASLCLTDFRAEPLETVADELRSEGVDVATIAADLGDAADRARIAALALQRGTDTLINIAGINPFGLFTEQSEGEIERAIAINTLAPMLLCRALLPVLARQAEAQIVNVGSVFGSIGYPGFVAYSASKFAMRGFSEALRRELADTPIRVHYVAPRATQTALSTDRIRAMNEELKVAMDSPETVAAAIAKSLGRSRRDVYLGRPERFFRLINAVMPRLIDRAIRKQLGIVFRYASGGRATSELAPRSADPVNLKIAGV